MPNQEKSLSFPRFGFARGEVDLVRGTEGRIRRRNDLRKFRKERDRPRHTVGRAKVDVEDLAGRVMQLDDHGERPRILPDRLADAVHLRLDLRVLVHHLDPKPLRHKRQRA